MNGVVPPLLTVRKQEFRVGFFQAIKLRFVSAKHLEQSVDLFGSFAALDLNHIEFNGRKFGTQCALADSGGNAIHLR